MNRIVEISVAKKDYLFAFETMLFNEGIFTEFEIGITNIFSSMYKDFGSNKQAVKMINNTIPKSTDLSLKFKKVGMSLRKFLINSIFEIYFESKKDEFSAKYYRLVQNSQKGFPKEQSQCWKPKSGKVLPVFVCTKAPISGEKGADLKPKY